MLETHVTNLEQSRKLYELGFIKDTVFYWTYFRSITNPRRLTRDKGNYPAYLLSEIMEALKDEIGEGGYWITINKYTEGWGFCYTDQALLPLRGSEFTNKNPVIAACDLLIWCIENGFISTK